MADTIAIEPWFFDVPLPPIPDERARLQLEALNVAGRRLMLLMFRQIALGANVPLDAITPDYAHIGVEKARLAVCAAAEQPEAQPESDLEGLALSYVDLLRDWTHLLNTSQGWTSHLQ